MKQSLAKLDSTGRLLIPSHLRKQAGLSPGSEVVLSYQDGELRVYTRERALEKVQALAGRLARPGVSVVEELIADRRKAAARELED